MRILSVGKRTSKGTAGITLIEMLVVVAVISIMVGIAFPSMTSGIDAVRLNSATQSIVSLINTGVSRAERRQHAVLVTIAKAENALYLRSVDFERKLVLPDGITIESVSPEGPPENVEGARSFMLYPGGTVPAFGVLVVNRRRSERFVRVDPITGVPRIENPANK